MTHSSNQSIFDLSLGAASLFVTATVVLRWPCWRYRLSVISSRLWWRAETFLKLNAEAVWTLKPVFPVLFWQPRVHVQVCSVFLPLCSFGSAVFPRCCHSPRLHSMSFVVRLSVVFTSLAYMLPGFHILVILCLGFHHILSMFFVPWIYFI